MNIRGIAKAWLKENGYDGLYVNGECACILNDLMPCGEPHYRECFAGYTQTGEAAKAGQKVMGFDYMIGAKKSKEARPWINTSRPS